MVLVGILFLTMRAVELFFLIPIIGVLGELVHGYLNANELTPSPVLTLFIVSVIAGIWVLATMLFYLMARHNGYLLAFVDFGIFVALIAGVAVARNIGGASCSNFPKNNPLYDQAGIWVYQIGDFCNLLKAGFAISIMEIIFFFITTLLALWVHHHHRNDRRESYRTTEKRVSRHSRGRSSAAGSQRSYSRGPYPDDRSIRGPARSRSRARSIPRSHYDGSQV